MFNNSWAHLNIEFSRIRNDSPHLVSTSRMKTAIFIDRTFPPFSCVKADKMTGVITHQILYRAPLLQNFSICPGITPILPKMTKLSAGLAMTGFSRDLSAKRIRVLRFIGMAGAGVSGQNACIHTQCVRYVKNNR